MVSEQKDCREANRLLQRQTPPVLHFGACRLDQQNAQLWRENQALRLTPKAFHALHYLASHPGQLVTKDELFQAVWPKTVVSGTTLTSCIKELRKVLEDDAKAPCYIETVHRRGYRWITETRGVGREAYLPSFPVSSFQSQASHQALTIVDREAELTQLHGWLESARAGERQIVFVTGEPGIGKTTVVETFLSQLAAAQEPVWVGRGQCIEQYGAGEAYMPVLEALGRLCRETEGERLIALLRQYAPTWLLQMPALLSEAEREELQHQVQGTTHERMLREMAEVVEMITAERPLVLWLEDLHWSDYSTLELLSVLARRQEQARVLVLGTYRPVEVLVRDHPLKGVRHELQLHGHCQELALPFLSEDAVGEYLSRRFAGRPLPAGLGRVIHHQTDGNPLFMVTVTNYLLKQGVLGGEAGQQTPMLNNGGIGVPDNLRQLIERQIEQVSAEERAVLEVASVAGAEFSSAAVAAGIGTVGESIEEVCEVLARRGQFIKAGGTTEWPDNTLAARYCFIHALYQEVLYERIPLGRRVSLHLRIGARQERAYQNRAGEVASELALHFERGRDQHRAVRYLQQAGENALRRYAYQEAVLHLTKGLELLKALPDTREQREQKLTLLIALGTALVAIKGYGAPEVEHAFSCAHTLCQQLDETPQLAWVLGGLHGFYLQRAEHQTAYELGERLLTLAQSRQDPPLLLQAHLTLGASLFWRGEAGPAQEHCRQENVFCPAPLHQSHAFQTTADPRVMALAHATLAQQILGYPEQALKRGQAALALTRELAHPFSVAVALTFTAVLSQLRREPLAVHEGTAALIALSEEHGFPFWAAWERSLLGWALVEQGQGEAGIASLHQGLAGFLGTGSELGRPYVLALFAQAYGKTGRAQEGLGVLADALAVVDRTGEQCWEAELYQRKGELTLQQVNVQGSKFKVDNPSSIIRISKIEAEAEACFLKAIDIARRQDAKSLELRAVMSLSRLWQQQGKKTEAVRRLAEISDWFTEGFDTADLQDAKSLLTELR